MARTNIDIDDELCRKVMDRFHLSTKREAVNLALRHLAGEPLDLAEARSLRGSGWDGDLDEMLPTTPADFESAAVLYRSCRSRGETVAG